MTLDEPPCKLVVELHFTRSNAVRAVQNAIDLCTWFQEKTTTGSELRIRPRVTSNVTR